ncbi:MAG TPA: hypothetical protein VK550_17320 [Polyangiaceae bacterium]|nr:hypothetical protein [Polyangiaceae bacterium]
MLRQCLRETGPLTVDVFGQHQFELAATLHQALEPQGQRSGHGVEIAAENLGDSLGELSGAIDEHLAHGAEHALALALDGLRIEATTCLPQCEYPETKGVPGIHIAGFPFRLLHQLVHDLGIGDEECEAEMGRVLVGRDGEERGGSHDALFLSRAGMIATHVENASSTLSNRSGA